MEWYVIIILVGYCIAVLFLDMKIVFYYESPDDSRSNQALVAKVVALLGLEFVWLILAGLPTDAFNARHDGGLDMELYWLLLNPLVILFLIFPVPFATAFYEADGDRRFAKTSPWIKALKSSGITFAAAAMLFVLLYFVLRPSQQWTCRPDEAVGVPPGAQICGWENARTPFFSFGWIALSFFGWWVTVLFLGVGLAATPLDLILGYVYRPQAITQQVYSERKGQLAEQIVALRAIGLEIRAEQQQLREQPTGIGKFRKQQRHNRKYNKFRQSVHLLEAEFQQLGVALRERGENPFFSYAKLAGGVVATLLSLAWVIDMVFSCIVPSVTGRNYGNGFLAWMLRGASGANFYLIDLVLCTLFVGYLMLCCMIGCFRFNMRMFCCCSIHPMKKNLTLMNSILFNVSIVLACSVSVCHFAFHCLGTYVQGNSYLDRLFNQYAAHTPVLGAFFRHRIFEWLLLIWAVLATVGLCAKPRDYKAFTVKDLRKLLLQQQEADADGARAGLSPRPPGSGGSSPADSPRPAAETAAGRAANFSRSVDDQVNKAMGQVENFGKFLKPPGF